MLLGIKLETQPPFIEFPKNVLKSFQSVTLLSNGKCMYSSHLYEWVPAKIKNFGYFHHNLGVSKVYQ